MPKKELIKLELTDKEDALFYAEKTLGRNETVRKRAKVLYYAGRGAESIAELSNATGIHRDFIIRTLRGYSESGSGYIYNCGRGRKTGRLECVEDELVSYLKENPPSSVAAVVRYVRDKYDIEITATPVRLWMKKNNIGVAGSK